MCGAKFDFYPCVSMLWITNSASAECPVAGGWDTTAPPPESVKGCHIVKGYHI